MPLCMKNGEKKKQKNKRMEPYGGEQSAFVLL